MTKDALRKNIHLVQFHKTTDSSQDYNPCEFIDEDSGDPDIFYTYKCPECQHMLKGHVFYMSPPACRKCGAKMKHADSERRTLYYPDTDEWFNKRLAIDSAYPYYNEQNLCDIDWTADDIYCLSLLEVEGRRGVRIFAYDIDGRPLGVKFYYDDRDMLQVLLER